MVILELEIFKLKKGLLRGINLTDGATDECLHHRAILCRGPLNGEKEKERKRERE